MFEKLLKWLKEKMAEIFGAEAASEVVISDKMQTALELWVKMYEDGGPWCNPKTGVHSIGIPTGIAEEFARLVTAEMEVTVSGSSRAEALQAWLDIFLHDIKKYVELGAAFGSIAFKPYVSGGKVFVDAVQADKFFPTDFDDTGRMTGVVFASQLFSGKKIYTRLEKHLFAGGVEKITNRAFESTNEQDMGREIPLTAVEQWADIAPEAEIADLEAPLFSVFVIPGANSADRNSPLGSSVYAKAVQTIRDADEQYGSLIWEYRGGELAVDADETLLRHDEYGNAELPQRQKRLFREFSPNVQNTLYEVFAPTLRDASYREGLNAILRKVEFQCGLAYGTISDPQAVEKTATEILSSRQRSYSTVKSIQKSLQDALDGLIYAMNVIADLYSLAPAGEYEIAYYWDDSLVNDPAETKQRFWGYVQAGKFPFAKYLQEFEGYSEDEAKAIAAAAVAEAGAVDVLSFGG